MPDCNVPSHLSTMYQINMIPYPVALYWHRTNRSFCSPWIVNDAQGNNRRQFGSLWPDPIRVSNHWPSSLELEIVICRETEHILWICHSLASVLDEKSDCHNNIKLVDLTVTYSLKYASTQNCLPAFIAFNRLRKSIAFLLQKGHVI